MCIALKKIMFRNRVFSLTLVLLLILAIIPIGAFANIGDGYDDPDEIVEQIGDGENGEDGDYVAGNEQDGNTGENQDGDAGNEQGGDNGDGDDDIIVDEIEDEIPEESEPYWQTLEAIVYAGEGLYYLSEANERIKLTGCFPEDAYAIAFPVELSLDLGAVVAAYDIAVYDVEGELFEPESAVTVELELENMPELEEDNLVVVRVPSSGAYRVLNTELYVSAYGFEFEADYLSVLAVVSADDYSGEDEEEIIDEEEDEIEDEIIGDLIEEEDVGEEDVIEKEVVIQPYYQELIANVYKDKASADDRGSLDTSGVQITVSGVFPDLAYVIAYPVELVIETGEGEDDVEVIAAYDITIYSESGEVIQPDETVTVSIILPELEGIDEDITVYHVPDDGGEPEAMETHVTDNGVEFETDHFSTYAVTIGIGTTFTYTVNGGSQNTVTMTSTSGNNYTASIPIDSPDSTLTISGSSSVTINSVSLNNDPQSLGGKYTVSPGDKLVINYTRSSTVYTLTLSITAKSFSYTHIDVKTAAATDDISNPLTVTALNYVKYTINNTTYTLSTDMFDKDNAEWSLKSKTLSLTQDVKIEISVVLSNGNTVVSEIDMADVYKPGTKYKATNDGASKIGTYFGISADSNGYYDISGQSIFLISTLTCNGLNARNVSLGSISTSQGGMIGLDLVLSTKTLIDTSYSLGLTGTKKLYDKDKEEQSITDGQFSFILTETDADWIALAGNDGYSQEVSCDSNGNILFPTIDYKELKVPNTGESYTYKYYTVTEKDLGVTGYEYSEWMYYITVKIKIDSAGNTMADVTYKCKTSSSENAVTKDSIEFVNYYDTGTLEITKQVFGTAPEGSGEYTILVNTGKSENPTSAYQGAYYIREGANDVVDEGITLNGKITIKDGQTIVIKGLAYDTYYDVSEEVPDGAGYYDSYTNATGQVTSSNTLAKVVVTNTYINSSLGVSVTAEKKWVGDGDGTSTRPVSIEVTLLYENGQKVNIANNPATLNSSNNWTYTWTGLSEGTYHVDEVDVLENYEAEIIKEPISDSVSGWNGTTSNNVSDFEFDLDEFIVIFDSGGYFIWTPLELSKDQERAVITWLKSKNLSGNTSDSNFKFKYGYGKQTINNTVFEVTSDGWIRFLNQRWSHIYFGKYIARQVFTITNTFQGHDITIRKVAGDGTTTLPGAQFELYKYDVTASEYIKVTDNATAVIYTTDANGITTINNLISGNKYMLKEIAAPSGYKKLGEDIYFTISANGTVMLTDANGDTKVYIDVEWTAATTEPAAPSTLTITNHAFVELPETGGGGLLGFTMFGFTAIFGGASALMVIQKAYSKKRRAFHKINGAGSGD